MFTLSKEQQERFHCFFEFINNTCIDNGLKRLLSNVRRLGLIFTRLCMVLSYLRDFTAADRPSLAHPNKIITCTDADFEIVLSICKKIIFHLLKLDDLYEGKNPTQQKSQLIHDNKRYSNEIKKTAINLKETGLSFAVVAENILGDKKKKGTIQKWYTSKKPFPVSETETVSEIIDTNSTLKNTEVSFFDSVSTNKTEDKFSLLSILTGENFYSIVDEVRKATLNDKQKLKKGLPAFTPSGIFHKERKKENLIKHSKFICIDIDGKDNEHISNFEALKEELSKIINIAYIGVSVSGTGYFLLIPISNPELHERYFTSIQKAFSHLSIIIDKACKDVSRLRIVSYDPDPYISERTSVLENIVNIKASAKEFEFIEHEQFNELIGAIEESETDITQSYQDWFSISCAIANSFGEEGRQYFHRVSRFYTQYSEEGTNKQYDACLKHKVYNGYTLSTVFYIANNHEIDY